MAHRSGPRLMLHEVLAGGAAVLNLIALAILFPRAAARIPDADRLVQRAFTNLTNLALVQLLTCLGVALLLSLLLRWRPVASRLVLGSPGEIFATLLRAAGPLLTLLTVHQSVPLWQHMTGWPDADPALIWLDRLLFFGTDPILWLERLVHPWLTQYMWAVYLAWFVAFQGTIYLLAALRHRRQWQDMVCGTMMTLILGYIGYVLVPAVGPIHAQKAQFTVDLMGGPVGMVTTGIVDKFGVWRDAFPSLHVAVSMLLLLYSWRYLRRVAPAYTVLCVSIIISTMYLRWHYVVDVIAGMALSTLCFWAAPHLIGLWERTGANGHSTADARRGTASGGAA